MPLEHAYVPNELPAAFLNIDFNGLIQDHNAMAADLLSRSTDSIKGICFTRLVSEEQKSIIEQLLLETFLYKGKTISCSLHFNVNGRKTAFEVHSSSSEKTIHPTMASLLIFNSHTRKICSMDKKDGLEQTQKAVTSLFHDLRTPMTTVKLAAQMLSHNRCAIEKQQKLFDIMIEQLDRADGMIRTLLDLSRRATDSHDSLPTSWCDLREVIHRTVETMNALENLERKIQCHFTGECFSGEWNKEALQRIAENLIINAQKYGTGDITVGLEDLKNSVRFKVHNYGEPIPPHDLTKIFDAFHRCSSKVTANQTGWGLGLSLVNDLVKFHSGTIDVKSSSEAGTCFTIELPKLPLNRLGSGLSYL